MGSSASIVDMPMPTSYWSNGMPWSRRRLLFQPMGQRGLSLARRSRCWCHARAGVGITKEEGRSDMLAEAKTWDAFLEAEVERNRIPPHQRVAFLNQRMASIRAVRENDWPRFRNELATKYGCDIPDGVEPHWTEGGRAVYWQHQIVSQIVERPGPDGLPMRVMEDRDYGWQPTLPLPANSAAAIAQFLRNGLRLRPPSNGEAEVSEAAAPDGVLQGKSDAEARHFVCNRHRDHRSFPTWKAYIQHCDRMREPIQEKPPPDVAEIAAKYAYYCFPHNNGFNNRRLAERHMKVELRKPGRAVHLSVEQMKV